MLKMLLCAQPWTWRSEKSNIVGASKQRKKVSVAFSVIPSFAKHMTFGVIHTVIVSLII